MNCNEYMTENQKIKIKVNTSTGINLLCAVDLGEKVQTLCPYIQNLYMEVAEDLGHHVASLSITKLKKDDYYIPRSQIIGQVLNDGDQIACTVIEHQKQTKSKQERKNDKKESKQDGSKEQKSRNLKQQSPEKNAHKKTHEDKENKETKQKKQKKKQNTEDKPKSQVDLEDLMKEISKPTDKSKDHEKKKDKKQKKEETKKNPVFKFQEEESD